MVYMNMTNWVDPARNSVTYARKRASPCEAAPDPCFLISDCRLLIADCYFGFLSPGCSFSRFNSVMSMVSADDPSKWRAK